MGKRVRKSFSKINEVLDMPDLIEVQKNSYRRLIEQGLKEVLDDISPITDYAGRRWRWSSSAIEIPDEARSSPSRSARSATPNYAAPPRRARPPRSVTETGERHRVRDVLRRLPAHDAEPGTFIYQRRRARHRHPARSARPASITPRTDDKARPGAVLLDGSSPTAARGWSIDTDSNGVHVRPHRPQPQAPPHAAAARLRLRHRTQQILDQFWARTSACSPRSNKDAAMTHANSVADGLIASLQAASAPANRRRTTSARALLQFSLSLTRKPLRSSPAWAATSSTRSWRFRASHCGPASPVEDVIHPATGEVLAAAGERHQPPRPPPAIQNAGVERGRRRLPRRRASSSSSATASSITQGPSAPRSTCPAKTCLNEKVRYPTSCKPHPRRERGRGRRDRSSACCRERVGELIRPPPASS